MTTTAPTPSGQLPSGPAGTWRSVFADDFTADTSLTAAWINEGWGNCTTTVDGTLGFQALHMHLASSADGNGCQIKSTGKFLYGAFQAVALMPSNGSGGGADHMGFWTAGDSWPGDGEFDIAEGGGGWPLAACTHAPNYAGCITPPGSWYDVWHTYTGEWFANPDAAHSTVVYYRDGAQVGRVDNLNLSTGGQRVRLNLFTCLSGCTGESSKVADLYVKSIGVWQRA